MEGITTVTTGYNQLSSDQPHWQLIGNDHTELQSQLVVVTHHIKLQDIIFNVENPKIGVKAIGPNQPNPLPLFTCGITTNSSLDSTRGNHTSKLVSADGLGCAGANTVGVMDNTPK